MNLLYIYLFFSKCTNYCFSDGRLIFSHFVTCLKRFRNGNLWIRPTENGNRAKYLTNILFGLMSYIPKTFEIQVKLTGYNTFWFFHLLIIREEFWMTKTTYLMKHLFGEYCFSQLSKICFVFCVLSVLSHRMLFINIPY